MNIIVPGAPPAPRAVHPAFARIVHECVRDSLLSHCPDLRALAVSTPTLVRMHVFQAIARVRGRRRLEAE